MNTTIAPDFIIVGAAKCGTTAVFEYLGEHPGVFITTPKETDFFFYTAMGDEVRLGHGVNQRAADMIITTADAYRALFTPAAPGQVRGEASPSYMLDARIPPLIHAWNPRVRIVMLLRDPAERAWSDFLHNQIYGTEPLPRDSFLEAFMDGERRAAAGWRLNSNYEIKGRYASQLARYLTVFSREQVGVFFYQDLRADPQAFMRSLYAFIGVDAEFTPDTGRRYNVSGVPKNEWLYRFLYHPNRLKKLFRRFVPATWRRRLRQGLQWRVLEKPPALPDEIRTRLAQHYLTETEALERLTGRDLSAWKPRGKSA